MAVEFDVYRGFLTVVYEAFDVKAYRNRAYYASNLASYEAANMENITRMIDNADDTGEFHSESYDELMRDLGRGKVDISELEAPEQEIHQWGPEPICYDMGVEKAAAYIAGLIVGREDVDSPSHPVWVHLEEEYRESYRRRARRVVELAGTG